METDIALRDACDGFLGHRAQEEEASELGRGLGRETCAGYLGHPFQKNEDVCHENQEGTNLCSMDRQADI
jgi:hypothetical protein